MLTALAMTATVRGTLSLADDANLVTHAQSLATTRVEDTMATPCGTGASGTDQAARTRMLWTQGGRARSTQLTLDLRLDPSPIALASVPRQFTVQAGGVCP